jgi:hypothetical protein
MKFSIRDLLLVTMIVALAMGWHKDHRRLTTERDGVFGQPARMRSLPNSSAPAANPPKP